MGTPTEEKTVESPKGNAAFDAARASIGKPSQDTATEEKPADTDSPEKQPDEPAEKPADHPTEAGEEPDTLLPAEEVSQLSAEARKVYDRMNKSYTTKTQALATQRKELEAWLPTIEALKTNPAPAIEQMAKQLGLKVSKEEAVQTIKQETLAEIPEELRPILEPVVKRIMAEVEAKVAPLKEGVNQVVSENIAAQTEATLKTFSAKYPGWEKYEKAMIAEGQSFLPGPGMDDFKYMEKLYKLVTADVSEAEKAKKVVEKINKSVESSEQKRSGVSEERVAHALPPPDKRSFREAYEAAKRGEVWEK